MASSYHLCPITESKCTISTSKICLRLSSSRPLCMYPRACTKPTRLLRADQPVETDTPTTTSHLPTHERAKTSLPRHTERPDRTQWFRPYTPTTSVRLATSAARATGGGEPPTTAVPQSTCNRVWAGLCFHAAAVDDYFTSRWVDTTGRCRVMCTLLRRCRGS